MKRFALLVALAACDDTLDQRITDPYWDNSSTWSFTTTSGDTPGHGDTIRDIYANDVAQLHRGFGLYPVDTILVKEVYENDRGQRGALQTIEIMRRTTDPAHPYDEELGWVFSATSSRGGTETDRTDFCFYRCHVNAPVGGAWLDYGP